MRTVLGIDRGVGDRHPQLDGAANRVSNRATLRHGSCRCAVVCVGAFTLTPQDPPTSPGTPPTSRDLPHPTSCGRQNLFHAPSIRKSRETLSDDVSAVRGYPVLRVRWRFAARPSMKSVFCDPRLAPNAEDIDNQWQRVQAEPAGSDASGHTRHFGHMYRLAEVRDQQGDDSASCP